MKLIHCNDCHRFHTIAHCACSMCHCGHSFFARKSFHESQVYVYGPCSVWMISDRELGEAKEGDIIRLKKLPEKHPHILRVSKGFILFIDQPDKRKEYDDAER